MSAHPARQLGCPAKQFHVCFGRPPAGPVLSTAWLSCAVRERISCCLIYFCCSLCRVPPRFLHQDQSFCRLSLGLAVGRGLEVRELLHPSMTLERPHPSTGTACGHRVPSAAAASDEDAGQSNMQLCKPQDRLPSERAGTLLLTTAPGEWAGRGSPSGHVTPGGTPPWSLSSPHHRKEHRAWQKWAVFPETVQGSSCTGRPGCRPVLLTSRWGAKWTPRPSQATSQQLFLLQRAR